MDINFRISNFDADALSDCSRIITLYLKFKFVLKLQKIIDVYLHRINNLYKYLPKISVSEQIQTYIIYLYHIRRFDVKETFLIFPVD